MRDTVDYQEWVRFGNRLRELRNRCGVTQTALAKSLGFTHPSSICNIEKGRRPVDDEEMSRLAAVLNCGIGELSGSRD